MSNIILTPIKMSTKQKISVTQYSPGRKIQGSDNASKIAVEQHQTFIYMLGRYDAFVWPVKGPEKTGQVSYVV